MVRGNKEMLSLGVFSQIPYRGRLAALTISTRDATANFFETTLRHLLNILNFNRDLFRAHFSSIF